MQTWGVVDSNIKAEKRHDQKSNYKITKAAKFKKKREPVIHCNKYRNVFSYDLRSHAFLWKKYVPTI